MYQTSPQKLIYRPKAGIFKTKQLEELKQEEDFKTATKFTENKQGNATKQQQDNITVLQ